MVRSSEEEQEIRRAAESFFGSSSSHHLPQPNESSINSIQTDILPPGDMVTGVRIGGRMSIVRRFFCLFVTFDLLLTVLMWLICIMLIGKNVFDMLSEEIVHYDIHTSLFDIVMAAAARFVFLLLFYALLYINHWCIIALTTSATCSFLVAKVFLYNWVAANSPVLPVLLIITSFVISWGEAWFLDFRVIPQETQAREYMYANSGNGSERTPLLRSYLRSQIPRTDDLPESVRNFYSPLDSPAGSDDEEGPLERRHVREHREHGSGIAGLQGYDLRVRGQDVLEAAWRSLTSVDWRLEKRSLEGDVVQSCARPSGGKLYHLEGFVKLTPDALLQLLFFDLEKFPSWNPTLIEAKRLQIVDEYTDVTYQVMAKGGGGMVTSRDFVTLRYWERRGTAIILASTSVSHNLAPPPGRMVRGNQGPSCWVMEPLNGGCRLRWLLDTDLRGWIPQALLDQAFAGAMLAWIGYLRSFAAGNDPTVGR